MLHERYRAIVQHYASLAKNPATKEHAWAMVDKFVNEGLPKLRKAVEKEINANNNASVASNGKHVLPNGQQPNEDQRQRPGVLRSSG